MNKFKTCKDCPDRVVEPNCHDTCKGYKARQEQNAKLVEAKRKDREFNDFKIGVVEKTKEAVAKARKRW